MVPKPMMKIVSMDSSKRCILELFPIHIMTHEGIILHIYIYIRAYVSFSFVRSFIHSYSYIHILYAIYYSLLSASSLYPLSLYVCTFYHYIPNKRNSRNLFFLRKYPYLQKSNRYFTLEKIVCGSTSSSCLFRKNLDA